MVIMQALLPDEEVASNSIPSSPAVTWREPVEVSTGSKASAGSENRVVSGYTVTGDACDGIATHGSRPPSSGSDAATPTTTFSRCGSGDIDVRNAQTDGCENPSGITENVLIMPVQGIPIIKTDLGIRKGIRSRSRPRRTDEPVPFLSVDTLPVDKVVIEGTCRAFKTARPGSGQRSTRSPKKHKDSTSLTNNKDYSVSRGSGHRAVLTPHSMSYGSRRGSSTSRASSNSHNYNSFFTHKNSAFLSGPPSLWSAGNKYWLHNNFPAENCRGLAFPPVEATSAKPNQHVTQPFKHDVDAPPAMDRPISPSQDLKERTLHAVLEVAKKLAKKTPPPTHTRNGRLLKGKLKPLRTFKLQGPSIEECKGIQTEERLTHTPSQARMMQRKRELLNKLPSDVFQSLTKKSVCHTTGASNFSEDVSVGYDLSIVSAIKTEETSHRPPDNELVQMLARMPPNSLASIDSAYDAAEHDATLSSSLQDTLMTTMIEVPDEDNNDCLKFIVNGNLENRHSTEVPPNMNQTLNLSTTGVGKQQELSAAASSEATMSDYLNDGGAASTILSDMVDRAKHSAQKMSEEAAEAVDGVCNDSMLVSSELASRGSDTSTYRSIASDDVAFDSASQWSARFSENSNYDLEANCEVLQENCFQDNVSISSPRVVSSGTKVVPLSAVKDILMTGRDQIQQDDEINDLSSKEFQKNTTTFEYIDSPTLSATTDVNDKLVFDFNVVQIPPERSEALSQDLPKNRTFQTYEMREMTDTHSSNVVINNNLQNQQVDQTEISVASDIINVEQSNASTGNSILKVHISSVNEEQVPDTPDKLCADIVNSGNAELVQNKSEDLKQSIKFTSKKHPSCEQSGTNDNGTGNQKPSSAISMDRQGSASDMRNTLLSMSVLSPTIQVMETCPASVLINQSVSNATDKSDNDQGEIKESKQKPLITKSMDQQGSASDLNTLLSMSVLSPSIQVMDTCPDSILTNQPISNATDKSESSKAEKDNNEGDTKESKQKMSITKSVDLQESASDLRNTLLRMSVFSPSAQVIETCPDSLLTNHSVSNVSDKSESCKAEEENDEDDTEESEQRDSCNKKDDSARRDGGGDGGDGPNGESGGSSEAGGGTHGDSNTDSGDNGGGYEHGTMQGNGDLGDGSQGNKCGNSENAQELNDDLPNVECSFHGVYEQSRTEQSCNNNMSKSIFNCPSCQPPQLIGKKVMKCWYGDLEDDIPEIDDSVLFCGICGLDEDCCLCSLSSLASTRNQSGKSLPTYTKVNTNQNSLCFSSSKRLFSAPGTIQHNRTASDVGDSNLSSYNNKIVLKYKTMQGGEGSTGIYSMKLASLSPKHDLKTHPFTYFLLRGVSATSGEERQIADVDKLNLAVAGSACKRELLELASPCERVDPNTLEVIAQAKTISRPRSAKNKPTRQLAPFPPLCFRINVRPPSGKLFYFAYGVNMNPKRMTAYLGCPVERRWGVLFGFNLKFNKKGSDLEAGGFPNIEFDPESSVEGCVYVITQTQLNMLNMFMGCPEFYTCAMFPVWMSNSYQPEDFGVAQYCVPALTYIAQDKWTHTDPTMPLSCHYSVDQCLKGSNLLTTNYVHHIKAQAMA